MGFEPTRAEHNGLAVHRLNHSATLSLTYSTPHAIGPDSGRMYPHKAFFSCDCYSIATVTYVKYCSNSLGMFSNWWLGQKKEHKLKIIPKKKKKEVLSTRMGFEPTRAEHNGLAVHRLNHSATLSAGTHLTIFEHQLITPLSTPPSCSYRYT